jgi:hypothetical protein
MNFKKTGFPAFLICLLTLAAILIAGCSTESEEEGPTAAAPGLKSSSGLNMYAVYATGVPAEEKKSAPSDDKKFSDEKKSSEEKKPPDDKKPGDDKKPSEEKNPSVEKEVAREKKSSDEKKPLSDEKKSAPPKGKSTPAFPGDAKIAVLSVGVAPPSGYVPLGGCKLYGVRSNSSVLSISCDEKGLFDAALLLDSDCEVNGRAVPWIVVVPPEDKGLPVTGAALPVFRQRAEKPTGTLQILPRQMRMLAGGVVQLVAALQQENGLLRKPPEEKGELSYAWRVDGIEVKPDPSDPSLCVYRPGAKETGIHEISLEVDLGAGRRISDSVPVEVLPPFTRTEVKGEILRGDKPVENGVALFLNYGPSHMWPPVIQGITADATGHYRTTLPALTSPYTLALLDPRDGAPALKEGEFSIAGNTKPGMVMYGTTAYKPDLVFAKKDFILPEPSFPTEIIALQCARVMQIIRYSFYWDIREAVHERLDALKSDEGKFPAESLFPHAQYTLSEGTKQGDFEMALLWGYRLEVKAAKGEESIEYHAPDGKADLPLKGTGGVKMLSGVWKVGVKGGYIEEMDGTFDEGGTLTGGGAQLELKMTRVKGDAFSAVFDRLSDKKRLMDGSISRSALRKENLGAGRALAEYSGRARYYDADGKNMTKGPLSFAGTVTGNGGGSIRFTQEEAGDRSVIIVFNMTSPSKEGIWAAGEVTGPVSDSAGGVSSRLLHRFTLSEDGVMELHTEGVKKAASLRL